MPTYEYRCPAGHEFEHFVARMSDASGTMECPTCGAIAERRISAGGGLLFKGSGFYITDYGKDGKKDQRAKASAGDKASAPDSGSKPASSDSKKGDSKPAASPKSPASSGGDK